MVMKSFGLTQDEYIDAVLLDAADDLDSSKLRPEGFFGLSEINNIPFIIYPGFSKE